MFTESACLQNNRKQFLASLSNHNRFYAVYNAVPNKGELTLKIASKEVILERGRKTLGDLL